MPTKHPMKKPIIHKKKKQLGFLGLPGELRNQIYRYHYEIVPLVELLKKDAPHIIGPAHSSDVVDKQPGYLSTTPKIRCGKFLGKFNRVEGMSTNWSESISGLHITNKQIYRECISFLYRSIAIFAQSSKYLNNFLTVVPTAKLKAITRLQLDHQTYGPPRHEEYNVFQKKYEISWDKSCKLAVHNLPNLRRLQININILDVPFRFLFTETWVQPFLHFAQLKHLEHVSVALYSWERMSTKMLLTDPINWQYYPPGYVQTLAQQHEAVVDIHALFGKAISMKILGYCDDCALEAYRKAALGKYRHWSHPSGMGLPTQDVEAAEKEKHEIGECLATRRSLEGVKS
ncbi:hypothetical protein EJ08DRAFT_693018 [Tothia fuscella]|uniref:DUF7730 domain-containing protein n=1 Tax=Tothia fuscella TaxID=1048955 RepID=A0A9P4U3N5_9PEZI|nr:hypothetical protein EJ08DRAFT_693018 [Tothia fuscella]